MDALFQVLGYALAFGAAMAARYVMRSAFWRRVAARAQRYYDDPNIATPDTLSAAERALLDEQKKSVSRVAAKIQNGSCGDRTDGGESRGL